VGSRPERDQFGTAFGDLEGNGNLDIVYGNYHDGVTVLRNDSAGIG